MYKRVRAQVAARTILVEITLCVAGLGIACSKPLSESTACAMATGVLQQNQNFRNVRATGCYSFESTTEQGTAKIAVGFDGVVNTGVFREVWEERHGNGLWVYFKRTDQGWKVVNSQYAQPAR